MRKLRKGCSLTREEWLVLVKKRVEDIVPLFRKYTLPTLGDLACLSPEHGKNYPGHQYMKISDDNPKVDFNEFWDSASTSYIGMYLSTPGLFFWPRRCVEYGNNIKGPQPYEIERTGVKRFFGFRGDYYKHWVIGWVNILPKEKDGRRIESAVSLWICDLSYKYNSEPDPMINIVEGILRHTGISESEFLIMLSEPISKWTNSQWTKYSHIRGVEGQMTTENGLFRQAGT